MAEDNHSPPPFSSHETFLYQFEDRRIIARRETNYAKAISKCREMFPSISGSDHIIIYTDELFCCNGRLAEISSEIWGEAISSIRSVMISIRRHLPEVDLVTPDVFNYAGDKVLLRPEFFMAGERCDISVYMAPTMKLQKLSKFVASTMKISEGQLLLVYQGCSLDLDKSIQANGLPSGSTIQCIQLPGDRRMGAHDSEETNSAPFT